MPNPGIAILGIRQKRDKQNIHAFVGKQPAQFRKLHVITYKDADFPAIRIKCPEFVADLHPPYFCFIGRYVEFFVSLNRAVSFAQITHIVKQFVLYFGHAAGDDVDVVGNGQLREFLDNGRRVLRQFPDGFGFRQMVVFRH